MKKFVLSYREFNEQIINPDGGNAAKDRSKTEILLNIRNSQESEVELPEDLTVNVADKKPKDENQDNTEKHRFRLKMLRQKK